MAGIYFGIVYQIETPAGVPPITNFRLPDGTKPTNVLFTGIPLVVGFTVNINGTVGLYKSQAGDEALYFGFATTLTTVGIQIYTNTGLNSEDRKYFSTLKKGNVLSDAVPGSVVPPVLPQPEVLATVPSESQYYTYPYFTQLNYGDVNLNNSTVVTLGWSSSVLSGSYGDDIASIRIYRERFSGNGVLAAGPFNITNNTTIPTDLFSTLPSEKYFYTYDFATPRIALMQQYGYNIDYTFGSDAQQRSGTFTLITQFLQSVSATNVPPGGTSTISIDVGVGYKGSVYVLSINDSNSFSEFLLFFPTPYTYTPPPSVNTITYTATVSNVSDDNDTNIRSTTFIAYQYVTNLAISTRILQSSKNLITWTGGSIIEQFQYGTTAIRSNGSLNFRIMNAGVIDLNKVDSAGFTPGIPYAIQPTNANENNGSYTPFYFDSIAPNQLIQIDTNRNLQRYTLTWNAFYKASSPAPDGTRQYPVTFTGNGTTYSSTSTYNVVAIPYSAVAFGVPYTITVVDIPVATDFYFFDTPTNFTITPNNINFSNTITWTSTGNPLFNVRMGRYVFQSRSPYTANLTENIIDLTGDVYFWPVGSDESASILTTSYSLNKNTISITLPSSILVFSGVTFSFNVGTYLYPTDTYSLSLYRNGAVVQQLEATITNPFTWIPYKYLVTYQPGDQLYIKSNQHVNFGISTPFTLIVDTPTNIVITPSYINFSNTISWSVTNNPVLNVKMGDYVFQSSSPSTQNLTESIINSTGTISFWPIGADPSRAVVAGNYNLSANTIYTVSPQSFPVFSNVFFSFDIRSVLYRNDTYSLSIYRNGAVVKQLEATITNPFTWFPYNYVVSYQPGDQLYVKSNQHLNYGISQPFTLIVNASVVVDKPVYNLFSTILATMTIDVDVAFTARLNGATIIPVTFTQQDKQYTIQLKDYTVPLGNYRLEFLLVNSPTVIVSSPTFVVTTEITVDQLDYTIISTVNASVYVGVPTTFTVALQDADGLFPPIVLPSFTANLLSTYSFKLYGLPLTDANYILQFTSNVVLTSPIFFISQSYFSFEELIVPIPPSRATTNTLCVTSKKNNIPTTIISVKNNIVYPTAIRGERQYLVPCGVIPYLKEFTELLKTLTLRNALLFLIQKYNIPQNAPAVTNQKRYQLPTANSKVLKPIVQYTASFRLAGSTTGVSVGYDIKFVDKLSNARFVTLCNDDTKTFSSLYTDMLKNATYWISTLARFTKDGDFTYCVVRPVNGSLKQILTASITLVNNRLVFTPYILRLVLAFYEPYGAIDMTIMYSSKSLEDIYNYLVAAYEKIYLNPATAL